MPNDPPIVPESAKYSPGFMDSAETFAESDVTLTQTNTEVVNGGLRPQTDLTSSWTGTESSTDYNWNDAGVVINPNYPVTDIDFNEQGQNSGQNTVEIKDLSDGSILASESPISSITGLQLTAGQDYAIYLYDSGGSSCTFGYADHGGFPETTTGADLVQAWTEGRDDWNKTPGFSDFTFTYGKATGTTYIEWAHPDAINDWDQALFQRSLDSETVDVYVEESTDGGSTWTEIAGPISRGDSIPASASSEVRFRVDLSRADMANIPTLDAIYRRFEV